MSNKEPKPATDPKPHAPAIDPKPGAAATDPVPEKEVKKGWRYLGPVSTLDLPVKDGKPSSRSLVTGKVYSDLPEDHQAIKNLIERKLLIKVGD